MKCFFFQFPRLVPSQLNFKPRVDESLIPDQPIRMLENGEYWRMPVMVGNVHDEWARSSGWFTRDLEGPDIGGVPVDTLCYHQNILFLPQVSLGN